MRYVKIISENEIDDLYPKYLEKDGMIYTNPLHNPNINLSELGYKELVIDEMPQFDEETQRLEMFYQDKGDTIHRSWRVINLTKEEIEQREQMKKELGV